MNSFIYVDEFLYLLNSISRINIILIFESVPEKYWEDIAKNYNNSQFCECNNILKVLMKMTSNANGELSVSETNLRQDNLESMRSSSGVGGDARARRLGKLESAHTAVFVCDIQEKFSSSIAHFDTIVNNSERLLKVANILGVPIIATEQYPKVSSAKYH